MYVITGATGNTGSVIAERLLEAGQKVRVVGRDPKRLEKFTGKGAESFVADMTDGGALTNAFAGAKAVYAMIPPNIGAPDVRAYMESVSDALRSAIGKERGKVCRRSEQRRRGQAAWNRSRGRACTVWKRNSKEFQG